MSKLAVFGGQPGYAFVAILSSQALIHSPSYPLMSLALEFVLLSCWLLAFPRGDGRSTRQKTARNAKLGNMARTVRCITLARPEEQLRKPGAMDPWSYAPRLNISSWPGPLTDGDMVFP